MPNNRTAAAMLGLLLFTTACGGSTDSEAAEEDLPRLQEAFDTCRPDDTGQTMEIGDAGGSLLIDTEGEDGSIDGMACALVYIDTPESVIAQVDRTSAMMGVQDAEANGFEYSWSYHPDSGVNMVITDTEFTQ